LRIGVIGPSEKEIMPFINEILNRKEIEYAMLKFYSRIYCQGELILGELPYMQYAIELLGCFILL
jgi:hypothetical protein